MATGKRYFWIKLKESFMTSDTVDFLMSQKDGANYVVLYQMLCLKTINTGGRLERQIGEVIIPFDVDKIQRDCKWFSANTIRNALKLYKSFGLVYEDVNGTIIISDHDSLVGSETDWASQKRKQIEKNEVKKIACVENGVENLPTDTNGENGVENLHTDIRDKILDNRYKILDKEIDDKQKQNAKRFSAPTLEEVKKYIAENNYNVDAERFVDYYTAVGWEVGKKKMKDWKAAVRNWHGREKEKKVVEQKPTGNEFKTQQRDLNYLIE